MKKSAQQNSYSWKAFIIYGSVVLFFILTSLLIKALFVVQKSKFDSKHQFILSIAKNNDLKEFIKFDPKKSEISVLESKDEASLVIPDAIVKSSFDLPLGADVRSTLRTIILKYNLVETDLTILDLTRLTIFSYKTKPQLEDENSFKNFFTDEAISEENITVEIINASEIGGMGRRVESVLDAMGSNIVAVTTARNQEKLSKIKYFGEETYTVQKLEKLLKFPTEKSEREGIADIVIVLGEDSKDTVIY